LGACAATARKGHCKSNAQIIAGWSDLTGAAVAHWENPVCCGGIFIQRTSAITDPRQQEVSMTNDSSAGMSHAEPPKHATAGDSVDRPVRHSIAETPRTDAHLCYRPGDYEDDMTPWVKAHVAWEIERDWNAVKYALEDARQLLADICNHEVNPEDEAEKWLRAYGWPNVPGELPRNGGTSDA
jgi:hypothetical protein